jgi:cobalamin biosynthesis protein CobT
MGTIMRILLGAILSVAMLSSCKAAPPAEQIGAAPPRASSIEQKKAEPGDPMSALDKDGSLKSPFSQEVALRLNEIMRRTKAVIDDFDKQVPQIRQAVENAKGKAVGSPEMAAADEAISKLNAMHMISKNSLAELDKEGAALKATKQYYSETIFSGMAMFATKVEKELADEINLLSAAKK